jgi:hypothetical protein
MAVSGYSASFNPIHALLAKPGSVLSLFLLERELPIFGRMRAIPPMLNAGARISALICNGFDWIEPELELL